MKKTCLAYLVSTVVLATSAHAQNVDQQASDNHAEADSGGDIVVTATRQSTMMSKTPVTMSAITGDGLRAAGVTDARGLSDSVPGLALNSNGDSVRIAIRGVTSTDTTEKGDPSAAFLLDGVYIARPSDALGSFYDVNRVEVLRGPQGTLYGRNTTAGVINVISNAPTDKFEASLDGSYGNLGTATLTGMLNLPVGDNLGFRAAANYDRQDPFYKVDGSTPYKLSPYREAASVRLSFGGKLGDNLTFVIRGDYNNTKGTGLIGNLVTLDRFYNEPLVPTEDPLYVSHSSNYQRLLTVPPAYPNRRNDNSYGLTGEFTYDFGPVQLTYLGAYRETDRHDVRSYLFFGALSNPATFDGNFKQDSHELRLAFGQGSALHGQVGAYYFHEKSNLELNVGAPLSTFVAANATGYAFLQGPTVARSKAVFGQVTYDITPELRLTGGVRYTHDFKSRYGATVADFADTSDSICGATRCVLNENIASKSYEKTIWKAGVDYDVPGIGLVYATVSTGYKAGGFNDGCITGEGTGCGLTESTLYYDPETLTNYEAGVKFRLSSEARFNVAVFHYDYRNLQVSQVLLTPTPVALISNAAQAKVDGLEFEGTFKPSDNDTLEIGYTYTDARYSSFTPDPINYPNFSFTGRALDHAPKHVVTAGYTHVFPLGNGGEVELGARTRLSSEYYILDLNNLSQFRQPSFTKTDLTATYNAPDERYYIQAFIKNLEDKITLANAASGLFAGATIEAPRQYGVRAGVKF